MAYDKTKDRIIHEVGVTSNKKGEMLKVSIASYINGPPKVAVVRFNGKYHTTNVGRLMLDETLALIELLVKAADWLRNYENSREPEQREAEEP